MVWLVLQRGLTDFVIEKIGWRIYSCRLPCKENEGLPKIRYNEYDLEKVNLYQHVLGSNVKVHYMPVTDVRDIASNILNLKIKEPISFLFFQGHSNQYEDYVTIGPKSNKNQWDSLKVYFGNDAKEKNRTLFYTLYPIHNFLNEKLFIFLDGCLSLAKFKSNNPKSLLRNFSYVFGVSNPIVLGNLRSTQKYTHFPIKHKIRSPLEIQTIGLVLSLAAVSTISFSKSINTEKSITERLGYLGTGLVFSALPTLYVKGFLDSNKKKIILGGHVDEDLVSEDLTNSQFFDLLPKINEITEKDIIKCKREENTVSRVCKKFSGMANIIYRVTKLPFK